MKKSKEIKPKENGDSTADHTEKLKSVCVYCGASKAAAAHFYELAENCGKEIASRGYRLVYGGGGFGLMGATAHAAQDAGGDVLGIIPKFLTEIEGLLTNIPHRVVKDMHERKHQMYEESDAFIVLPGGIGTLEEAVEIMSWMRLHLHSKPMIFVDTDGYWAPFITLIDHTSEEKFAPEWLKDHLFRTQSLTEAMEIIEKEWAKPTSKGDIHIDIDIDDV